MNEIHTHFDNTQEKIIESVSQKFDKQNARVDDIINNFKKKKVDDNYEIKVGVEGSKETDKLNENKDGQLTYEDNKVCLLYTSRCV